MTGNDPLAALEESIEGYERFTSGLPQHSLLVAAARADLEKVRRLIEAAKVWRVEHLRARTHVSDLVHAEDVLVHTLTTLLEKVKL